MSGLIESAAAILDGTENRLAIAARNVANMSTSGYKKSVGFSRLLNATLAASGVGSQTSSSNIFTQGAITGAGSPLDLAISGDGFFVVRAGDETILTRQGHFALNADGTVATPQGYLLQDSDGGDLVLDRAEVSILEDGTVLDGERAVGHVAVATTDAPGELERFGETGFVATGLQLAPASPVIRQAMVENSNVSLGEEMVTMTAAVRQAETGARLIQTYDDLLGRAITAFGQAR